MKVTPEYKTVSGKQCIFVEAQLVPIAAVGRKSGRCNSDIKPQQFLELGSLLEIVQ
jgi:hypothetical protein